MIAIRNREIGLVSCVSAIVVPEMALQEAGYIKMLTSAANASAKHEFHALAQMALFQYQDEEILSQQIQQPVTVEQDGVIEQLDRGLVIYRDQPGALHLLLHAGMNAKKLLEAAHRFCTRWVRLDI